MKLKLLITTLALIMTNAVFAASPAKPKQCPTVENLKSVGVSDTYWIRDTAGGGGLWAGLERNNYFGTEVKWTLLVGAFLPQTPKVEVIYTANAIIPGLVYKKGPEQESDGTWECLYATNKGSLYLAVAVYPSESVPDSNLIRYLKR